VIRLARLALAAAIFVLLAATAANAAPRMWIGFHDDPSFRWRTDRTDSLDGATEVGSTVIRAWVYWPQIAPTRPADPANPFDPAYRMDDLDELVRGAQARGEEVLFTIWGVPKWANGGKGANYAPKNYNDWQTFCKAVAARYSGRNPGYPFVRFYSVWNEPNLNQFLAPQFTKGKPSSPAIYAKLYRAAYAGIKAGSPSALVGAGETSPRGRDKPLGSSSTQDTLSPGNFAQLVSQQKPLIKFDAWAHHPYPTDLTAPVTQKVKWPNVSVASLPQFETSLNTWFKRKSTPIWIDEYGYQTKPANPKGVSPSQQAANIKQLLSILKGYSYVNMFVWFTYRDDSGNAWKSGIVDNAGARKPGWTAFQTSNTPFDARNAILSVPSGKSPTVSVSAIQLAAKNQAGTPIGVTYRVYTGGKLVAVAQPNPALRFDGWINLALKFTPAKGKSYSVSVDMNAPSGDKLSHTLTLNAT
jgi:hypothetical protein